MSVHAIRTVIARKLEHVNEATVVLAVFTAALFLSAVLLFSVQPSFTKMVFADARRITVGVGGINVLFPSRPAWWVLLRLSPEQVSAPSDYTVRPLVSPGGRACRPPVRSPERRRTSQW